MKTSHFIPEINSTDDTYPSVTHLDDFENIMNTAEMTLEYSLFLPKIQPISKATPEHVWITKAILQCFHNCHCNLIKTSKYHFFNPDDVFQSYYLPCGISSTLHPNHKNFGETDIFEKDFFSSTIMSQCIISSYDMATRLLPFKLVKPYTLGKLTNKGLCELQEKKLINTSNFKFTHLSRHNPSPGTDSYADSTTATILAQKIASHQDTKSDYFFNNCIRVTQKKGVDLYSADLLYNLLDINASSYKSMRKLYEHDLTPPDKNAYQNWHLFCDIYNALHYSDYHSKISNNITDKLHYYYRLENIFAHDLASFLYKSINQLRNQNCIYPDGQNNISTIAEISCMPNVFSRNAYLQYAFEFIRSNRSVHHSCFLNPLPPISVITRIPPSEFKFSEWIMVFEKFCAFFNKLIFPAEQWYFFITLYKTVAENLSITEPSEIALKLQSLLSTYIDQNHTYITKYWNLPNIKDITPRKSDYDNQNPNISTLLSSFQVANKNTELSLAPFSKENLMFPGKEDNNYKVLLQFYSDFITNN